MDRQSEDTLSRDKKIYYFFLDLQVLIMKKRVNVYLDGFNFYFALKSKIAERWWKRKNSFKRCNYRKLFGHFLGNDEVLGDVYFFTAYKINDGGALQRHKTYIQALNSVWVKIILGKYLEKRQTYRKGNNTLVSIQFNGDVLQQKTCLELLQTLEYISYEEKETDVKIALQIVEDAFLNKYQKAIIVTGDSDIVPALHTVRNLSKMNHIEKKWFALVLIPWTKGRMMRQCADSVHEITAEIMEKSILPESMMIGNEEVHIPSSWKRQEPRRNSYNSGNF